MDLCVCLCVCVDLAQFSLVTEMVKNPGDPSSVPESGKSPWRREWLFTLAFLPGEFNGQRGLAGYSPWGHNKSDRTE